MQAGNKSTRVVFPPEMTQEELDAAWNLIQRNLHATLDGQKIDCTFEELYRNAYKMVLNKQGRFVYDGVRQLLKQHIDKKANELEQMANNQERNNQVLLQVDQLWRNFFDRMEFIRKCFLYMERVVTPQLVDGEELQMYGWRIFHTEILENQLIKNALANRLVLMPENELKEGSSVLNSSDDDDEIADYQESPLFNVDTIIEIMTFLTTLKLGFQLSTAARQMAKLSDYVLNKRKINLRPIAVWDKLEPFATHLQNKNSSNWKGKEMKKISDDWLTNMAPESRICLPEIDPPEWLAGVEQIYIMVGMHDKTYRFLNALRDQLQNCQLEFHNESAFFVKLYETGHSLRFFEFFNERCFSLVLDIPWRFRAGELFAASWPLCAIFNNIFFPNCRELTLSIDIDGMARWLMHSSTENQPRMLKLRSVTGNWRDIGNAAVTMLRHINEDFFNPTGKRMFFVEFLNGTAIPAGQQGEWQNGNGEQLRIQSTKITRLPVDQNEKDFKDFYQLPEVQPKLVFK